MDNKTYFAALPREDVGSELMRRCDNWYNYISASGHYLRMKKSYNAYYGIGESGTTSEITRSGVQGELALIKVNHFRNLVQHMLVMTTQQRPAMEARAVNSDFKSQAQTVLANGILDYYMREKNLERYLKIAAEMSLIFGEGYVGMEWDEQLGDEYDVDPDTQEIKHTGDLKYRNYTPLDIVKDVYIESYDEHEWLIVRQWKNKFSLAAKYDELADRILELQTKDQVGDMVLEWFNKAITETDRIPVYSFYHKQTDALPSGRLVVFCSDDIILYDGPLPYREIPVFRIAPGDFIGTGQGYTIGFDLLALQEAYDALCSAVVTNQSTFGVQNIMIPTGHNIAVQQLAGGLNLIEYDPGSGPPQALNLTNTPPEVFQFIDKLEKVMETISGVNSVARGNPEASLRSGNALALVQSMALQFNNGLQQSYAALIEDIGTSTLNALKDFAAAPRVAVIVGKNNRSLVKEFTGNDLDKVDRVIVDVGNPLAKTTAGKMEIADNLMQMGLIKTPQEYFSVLKTGDLDPLIKGDFSEIMLSHSENEELAQGKSVQALVYDSHSLHIKEHRCVLASPDARKNPEVVRAVNDHIAQHIELLRNTDPGLLMQIGEQPMPPPGQMQMPGQPPAPQGEEGGLTQDQAAAGQQAAETMGPPSEEMPGMPGMPSNPLSGNEWNPETGGL